jgi:DNA-binding beta-propeller fold protein YncE
MRLSSLLPKSVSSYLWLSLPLALACAIVIATPSEPQAQLTPGNLVPAPDLEGGVAWFNTGKPLKMKDLRGKIVLLDFWTLCCINCMHIMPELTKLEKKYPNQLVVIGVHSAKFENEKDSESIRKAISRYELTHPVVNDAEKKIWSAYGANWWPSLVLIDPEGRVVAWTNGEDKPKFTAIDQAITALIAKHRKNKTLDETPLRFDTAKFRDSADTPLYFPGKIVADGKGKRLFIADSTHHRIVVTDLDGKKIAIVGTGHPGNKDGAFEKAQFDDPQGMAVQDDIVYVADRKNNTIRKMDMKAHTVTTIAGTGHQSPWADHKLGGPALQRAINSPWDLYLDGQTLYVAMAGFHQIWTLNLKTKFIAPFAGEGEENIKDGPLPVANFAQPSGLTSDGRNLYVADSEVSAVRKVPIDGAGGGQVTTLVGRGLFEFGDRDGPGHVPNSDINVRRATEGQIQHAIGVAFHSGKLYVADTYNSKIKTIDLDTGMVSTYLGGKPKAGEEAVLNEPAGLSVLGDTLYVADTNAHRIRVIDLKTKAIKTLELKDVPPVEQAK